MSKAQKFEPVIRYRLFTGRSGYKYKEFSQLEFCFYAMTIEHSESNTLLNFVQYWKNKTFTIKKITSLCEDLEIDAKTILEGGSK